MLHTLQAIYPERQLALHRQFILQVASISGSESSSDEDQERPGRRNADKGAHVVFQNKGTVPKKGYVAEEELQDLFQNLRVTTAGNLLQNKMET